MIESTNQSVYDLQSQSQTYQSQLGKRKEMMDNTEQNLRAQISQLENQLQRTRDTVNSQVWEPDQFENFNQGTRLIIML